MDKVMKTNNNSHNAADLIEVDFSDNFTGLGSKEEIHSRPVLHRAFSVFIYHDGKMLIQKRNINKYHSGGLWTNACCSHMREGKAEIDCVSERLKEELGIIARPQYLSKFVYYHKFAENLFEYEYDHIYVLDYDGEFSVDPEEIEEIKWVDFKDLELDIAQNPEKYTVWFITALSVVLQNLT